MILLKRSNFGRATKTKYAKSSVCSRGINFRKQYFYIDIGIECEQEDGLDAQNAPAAHLLQGLRFSTLPPVPSRERLTSPSPEFGPGFR